jgi:hypothetical protein
MYSTGLAKSKGKAGETIGLGILIESVFDFELPDLDPGVKIAL